MIRYLQFNTGRQYAANGQLIQCRVASNDGLYSSVCFFDTSRGIVGEVKEIPMTPLEAMTNLERFAQMLMREYDTNRYIEKSFSYNPIRQIIQHFTQGQ